MTAKLDTKRWPWVGGAVLLVLISGFLLLNRMLAPGIGKKLTAAVSKGSDGGYQLRFEDIEVNIFTGSLALKKAELIADTLRLKGKPFIVQGNAQLIRVTGLSLWQYWLHKKVVLRSITVDGAVLRINRQASSDTHPQASKTLYQKLSSTLKMVSVDDIRWNDIRLDYLLTRKQPARLHLQKVDLEAKDLLIDSATQSDTMRTLYCRDIITSVHDVSGSMLGGAYHYHLAHAGFSTQTKRLVIAHLSLIPQDLHRFFAHIHAERFDVALDSITFGNVEYQRYFTNNSFQAGRIRATGGHVNVFGDPSGIVTPGDRVAGFPNFALRQVKVSLIADTVDLAAINVSYSELNTEDGKVGTINFAQTTGRFVHISNDTAQLISNAWCEAHMTTGFMNKGKLEISARFNLIDKACSYQLSGKLGPMEAVAINRVTMPLGLVRVKSGDLRSLVFNINGNRFKNTGNLELIYRDADLDILGNRYNTKPVQTLLANALVIAHDNPDGPGTAPRRGRLNYNRPANKAFFCAIWQTLFDGIKSCVEKTKSTGSSPPHQSLVKKILTAPVHLFKKK